MNKETVKKSSDDDKSFEQKGSIYHVPCPCCDKTLEILCYVSGSHKLYPCENSHNNQKKSSKVNFQKIQLTGQDTRKPEVFRDVVSRKTTHNRAETSTNSKNWKKPEVPWGSEVIEWITDSTSRTVIEENKNVNKPNKPNHAIEDFWMKSLCSHYKFDGACDVLTNSGYPYQNFEPEINNIGRSLSCDELDWKIADEHPRSGSKCDSYFSEADLSGISENSVESWYTRYKRRPKNSEWDQGFLISHHRNSNNNFIGIELLSTRNGLTCIPLTQSELHDLKKSTVYKFRYLPEEGFEVKPSPHHSSFLLAHTLMPQNQLSITVPGLVSYSNYSIEEMRSRKEKLHVWSDSVGLLSFGIDQIDYWTAKSETPLFEPLQILSITLVSKLPRHRADYGKPTQPEWDVINVEHIGHSHKMKRQIESCYPSEAFRFDDLRIIGRKDKNNLHHLKSDSFPKITITANHHQCLMDIERVKPADVLTAVVVPSISKNETIWLAIIVGQIERIVAATNDRISFFVKSDREAVQPIDKNIINYVKRTKTNCP